MTGFTKRLVFSAWQAVPRAAAGLLSYLAERRLTLEADPNAQNTPERRSSQRNRLAFTIGANERRTGMPALALLYPSPALAGIADPRAFATTHPGSTISDLHGWAREQVAPLLDRLPPGEGEGDGDVRWYWAAPLMLDANDTWWSHPNLAAEWANRDKRASAQESRWLEHVELARAAVDGTLDPPLGPPPTTCSRRSPGLRSEAPGRWRCGRLLA